MNAYELADRLDANVWGGVHPDIVKCTNMLRQQADRIAELEKELSWWRTNFKLPTETNEPRPNWLYTPQTKPLSDEAILDITKDSTIFEYREFDDDMVRFARAIEERHGIK